MQPEAPGLLWDARKATGLIAQFVALRTSQDYESDPMLRSAVERQFQLSSMACDPTAWCRSRTTAR